MTRIQIKDYKTWAGKYPYLKNTAEFLEDINRNYSTPDYGQLQKNSQEQYRKAFNAVFKVIFDINNVNTWPKNKTVLEKKIISDLKTIKATDDKLECYALLNKYDSVYKNAYPSNPSVLLDLLHKHYKLSAYDLYKNAKGSHGVPGEKEYLVKQRIGQTRFRDDLIRKYHGKCLICRIAGKEHLIASHIKPWKEIIKEIEDAQNAGASTKEIEKLSKQLIDTDDGLLLCPNHDHLFDRGYISFDAANNGKMMISSQIDAAHRTLFNISAGYELGYVTKITANMKKNMAYHNANVYKP